MVKSIRFYKGGIVISDNDFDKRIIELKKYLSKKELEFVENRYKGSNISIKENLEDLILLFENGNTEEWLSIKKNKKRTYRDTQGIFIICN